VLPVLVGQARPAAEGGGFGEFPFYKLARLSDAPSAQTNARAGPPSTLQGLLEIKDTRCPWEGPMLLGTALP